MKSYQDVLDYFIGKVDKFNFNQLVNICTFIINKIAPQIPDDFMQYELDEEQEPLARLHQLLLASNLQKQNISDVLKELDNILQEYGDDYPADMEMETMTLIELAQAYCNLLDVIEQNVNDTLSINTQMVSVISTYLDFLDYQASELDDVYTQDWTTYPVIKQGVQELDDYLYSI